MLELKLVRDFHRKYNIPILEGPSIIPMERIVLRLTLLNEELRELVEADDIGHIEEIAKEAGDVLYVLLGTALEFNHYDKFESIKYFESMNNPLSKTDCLRRMRDNAALFQADWSEKNLIVLIHDLANYVESIGLRDHFPRVFQEVHRSNMSKGTNGLPLIRADGKILKGEDFKAADMSFLRAEVRLRNEV
jgi:predicted HAD superfamily Cof-like phosphohydrolase